MSATGIFLGVVVVLLILIVALIGASAMKKRKNRSPGRVKVFKTRPGITIKIYPATPNRNLSEESLNNDVANPYGLVPPKVTARFRETVTWFKR